MLHLRVYTPAPLTAAVTEVLDGSSEVASLAVVAGASKRPPGDLILADIPRDAANEVVAKLREIGVQDDGAIQMTEVPTWVSRNALAVEEKPGASSDAVVWAEVTQQAYRDSQVTWSFLSFMIMATIIAAIGIVLDSQVLIIGAMVLGPEFGAVAAMGLALVRRRRTLLHRSVRTLLIGFGTAITVTATLSVIARFAGWVTLEDVVGPRPLTRFIYTPDQWSLVVALIAGAAGVLALTSARAGGLTGVFISVTTIPAAGNVALAMAFGVRQEILGSLAQLAINLTGMALAGWLVLSVQERFMGRSPGQR